jgi:hypothetical protein
MSACCLCNDAVESSPETLRDKCSNSETSPELELNNYTDLLTTNIMSSKDSSKLFSSVDDVTAYLDLRFGRKKYNYHVKTGGKNHRNGPYHASIQCPKSGKPKRDCVSLLLCKTICLYYYL